MYDLNFFSIPTKSKKRGAALPLGLFVILLAAAGIAAGYLWQQRQIADTQRDIDRMKAYLAAEPINSQLVELENLKQKTQLLHAYQDTFTLIDDNLVFAQVVDTVLLEKISGTLPTGVTFQALGISGDQLAIEGSADTSLAAAELLHNLKQTGLFASVHLQQLTTEAHEAAEDVSQHFTIQATGKEVAAP